MNDHDLIAMARERGGTVSPSLAETLRSQEQAKPKEKRPRMNKTEAAYAKHLQMNIFTHDRGTIMAWFFESVKIRLAHRTWYTPDFFVIRHDGSMEFHETKGFMRDDANVKLKVAASMYPQFTFRLVRKTKCGWDIKEISKR